MAFGNTTENDLCLLLFNNTNAALIGDATGLRGSSTAGSFYLSLHTATPGAGGTRQLTKRPIPAMPGWQLRGLVLAGVWPPMW